jgi:biotin carboxylase
LPYRTGGRHLGRPERRFGPARVLSGREPVDAILSVLQEYLASAALAARALGLRASSVEGLLNARDKGCCRELLREHGIASVRHLVTGRAQAAVAFAADVGYPVIAKPRFGNGKMLTAIVHDRDALLHHFAESEHRREQIERGLRDELTSEFIIEELARGPLYSIEFAGDIDDNWSALIILKRKTGRHNAILEMGSTVPIVLIPKFL